MNRLVLAGSLAIALLFLLPAPPVRADGTDSFIFTETTGGINYVVSWTLPASPGYDR